MINDVRGYIEIRRELQQLERRLAPARKDAVKVPLNVSDLILTWCSFGPQFGAGEATLLQDYVHSLLARDQIEHFLAAATPATRAYIELLISPTDSAFKEAALPIDSGLVRLFPRASDGWWRRVTPRRLGRELRREFGRLGGLSIDESP
jgi:hypothetical protein